MGGGLVGCSGGHFRIVVVLYEMLFNMGCEVPRKHCCSLWVEVISFSPLCGLGDR